MRKLFVALLVCSTGAFAQTNIGTFSIEQLGTANDVDAVCVATDLDIRNLTAANDTVVCNAGTNLNTSALALDATLTGRWPAGSTPADNESNAVTITREGAFGYLFDGTTWDRDQGARTCNAGTNLNTSALLTTAAHDAALGTAGAADAQVRTIQGVASMTPVQVSHSGAVQFYVDPCQREAKIRVSINQTAGTQLITGTASERIYICSFKIITATAQNVALVSGTGTVCATSPSGVEGFGGATAATGDNYAANGGLVLPAAGHAYGNTDTDADNVCLLQSGAGQVSGGLTYVSAASGL